MAHLDDHVTKGEPDRARQRAETVQRPAEPVKGPPDLTRVHALQRQAGNRAVAGLLGRTVQREQRPGGDDGQFRLHLDPEIEAQIRAITAMNAMMAPEMVSAGLLDLTLPALPPGPAPAAPSLTPPQPPPATAAGPAPGTGLIGPRTGTGGDIWKAILAEPTLGPTVTALGDQAAGRARSEWDKLSTGQAAGVVTGSLVVGGAAIAGILASPDARQWISSTLADKIIPVPKVPGLGVQLNLSGPTVIVGLHLDVGRILPKALGFGPASQTTPLGSPLPVQRCAADEPAPVHRHLADQPAPVHRHLADRPEQEQRHPAGPEPVRAAARAAGPGSGSPARPDPRRRQRGGQ
jgi:hypothetical protein